MRGDLCNLTDALGPPSQSPPNLYQQCDWATGSRAKVPADYVTARSSKIFQHLYDVPNSSTEDLPQRVAQVALSRCTTRVQLAYLGTVLL